jgi:hypothetical protein
MDRVHKPSDSECFVSSSAPFSHLRSFSNNLKSDQVTEVNSISSLIIVAWNITGIWLKEEAK